MFGQTWRYYQTQIQLHFGTSSSGTNSSTLSMWIYLGEKCRKGMEYL